MGEVLVTGIAKMYDEWDVASSGGGPNSGEPGSASENDDIESGEVLVFYYDDFDGYGGMNPMPLSDPIGEFAKAVSRARTFDSYNVSDLIEE
jgi:hypothetical protein